MRVLLVEDDAATKQSVEMMLASLGYDYDSVDLGEDGVDLAKKKPYDLILLDIMLPGMDGYDVLQQLQDANIETPVLLQSGLVDRDMAVQGLSLGVDDYLIKPYNKVELAVRIESALHRACLRGLSQDGEESAPELSDPSPSGHQVAEERTAPERRDSSRRNVLKSGRIYSVSTNQTMDCTILNLSDKGAALKPADPPYCPASFTLEISDGAVHQSEICWRYRDKVGVRFHDA